MITKKEANKLRAKELNKKWKKKYLGLTLDKLPVKFKSEYKKYNEPPIKKVNSFYIFGEAGTGKTVLACFMLLIAVKKLYMKRGYYPSINAHFVNFPDLLMELQSKIGTGQGYTAVYQQYLDCDILVLDDLAAKKITDWVGDIVYHIINHRYDNQKLTIITSNIELNNLANVFNDDRIIRRIEETYKIAEKEHFQKVKHSGKT